MTICLACQDIKWEFVAPGGDDMRRYFIACPECCAGDDLDMAAIYAAATGRVGWGLATMFVAGEFIYKPWPFFLQDDATDGFYLDHHPSQEEALDLWTREMDAATGDP